MTIATKYDISELQTKWQPMYDLQIDKFLSESFSENPNNYDYFDLRNQFIEYLPNWIQNTSLLSLSGFEAFPYRDICIGVTQYIDELYSRYGKDNIQILHGDYAYHKRLNPEHFKWKQIDELEPNKALILGMPMPLYGDIHPQMNEILDRCLELKIPVHIDSAWLCPAKDITFNFNHPAIQSFATSLSKPLCLGNQRIGLRFSREKHNDQISIMNEFTMTPTSLILLGLNGMKKFKASYLWDKYGKSNEKICKDFNLIPTNTIYLAIKQDDTRVGLRALLRYLSDKPLSV